MSIESLLLAILCVLILALILSGVATLFFVNTTRAMIAEQQATRRVIANMDWTTVFSNMQAHGKESVRILDILDKRLQKLEAIEKIQLTRTEPGSHARRAGDKG
jgi:uncharacterized protein YpmB